MIEIMSSTQGWRYFEEFCASRCLFRCPSLDWYPSFFEGVEKLSIQQFVTEFAVAALAVALVPWACGLAVEGSRPRVFHPLADSVASEFRPVIRPNGLKWTMGRISVHEPVNAMNTMTFGHGEIEILVEKEKASRRTAVFPEAMNNVDWALTESSLTPPRRGMLWIWRRADITLLLSSK
jgi:hypothetical protein